MFKNLLPKYSYFPQKGIVHVALIIFVLVGIAAGTILVQNGVNFLPKAASQYPDISKKDTSAFECNRAVLDKVDPHLYFRAFITDSSKGICIKQYAKFVRCLDNSVMPCPRAECKWSDADGDVDKIPVACPAVDSIGNTATANQPPGASENYCTLKDIKNPDAPAIDLVIKKGESQIVCDTNKKRVKYTCKGYDQLEPPEFIPSEDNKCTGTAPAAGTARKIKAEKCQDADAKKCEAGNKGCYLVDGKTRCVFDKISCTAADTKWCQDPPDRRQDCEVKDIIIEGVNDGKPLQHTQCTEAKLGSGGPAPAPAVPARPATGPAAATAPRSQPAAAQPASTTSYSAQDFSSSDIKNPVPCSVAEHNTYCAGQASALKSDGKCYMIGSDPKCLYGSDAKTCNDDDNRLCTGRNSSCIFDKVTVAGKGAQYSRCADTLPSFGDNQPKTGVSATGCEEFKEGNDLGIPCFKIGVFSPEDLQATEAHARLASARYVQFTQILDELKGKISGDIEKAARDRITAAEAAAKACLEKTK